jgi:hypothetical protein
LLILIPCLQPAIIQVPGILINYRVNTLIYPSLLSNTDIIRIAGFAFGLFVISGSKILVPSAALRYSNAANQHIENRYPFTLFY